MRLWERQLVFGTGWGLVAFAVAYLATYYAIPAKTIDPGLPAWKLVAWFYLSANFVSIDGMQILGFQGMLTEVDLLKSFQEFAYLRVVPATAIFVASLLVNVSMGYTTRLIHVVKNSAYIVPSYVGAVVLLVVVSDARPGVGLILGAFVVGGAALGIGVLIVRAVGEVIPVLGIASLSGIAFVGLLVLVGSIAVVETIGLMAVMTVVSTQAGALLVWFARRMNRAIR